MPLNDDELIAYLLGDANSELRLRIEDALSYDATTRERLSELRMVLGQMDSLRQEFQPPSDLAESTMARIDQEMDSAPQPASANCLSPTRTHEKRPGNHLDSPALGLCIAAICCMILPAVLHVRYQARSLQCADNLKETGQTLINYAINNPAQRYPAIPMTGDQSFSGYYVVQLQDRGTPIPPAQLQCPSLIGMADENEMRDIPQVVDSSTLSGLLAEELAQVQRAIGGDYAYTLGVSRADRIVAPKLQGSRHVAILADSPVITSAAEQFVAHSGSSLNMLYDDGRVMSVTTGSLKPQSVSTQSSTSQTPTSRALSEAWHQTADYPFRNHRGAHEAGLSDGDSSLAPSHFPPVAR